MARPETLAAVDLGSNSFHLQIGRVVDGQIYPLDSLREVVRLGAGLTSEKRIDRATQSAALETLAPGGGLANLAPGSIVAVLSTVHPRTVVALAEEGAKRGVHVELHRGKVRDDGTGGVDSVAGVSTVSGTRFAHSPWSTLPRMATHHRVRGGELALAEGGGARVARD